MTIIANDTRPSFLNRSAIPDDAHVLYERDGVICLRGVFDRYWVEELRAATEQVIAAPGPFGAKYGKGKDDGTFFGDMYVWTFNDTFRHFVYDSPAAEIAGLVMGSHKVNFFYDHLLVKEPGSSAPTPWHHDLPYWCVDGWQVSSVWMPLDAVDLSSGAVEYVRGSHRWGRLYEPTDFVDGSLFKNEELPKIPDIDAARDDYDIVAFETEPGDCLIHHALTLHGAPGNSSTRRRRALATRWTGDDARFMKRRGMSRPIRDPGLEPGAPMDSDLFPVVWRAAA